MLSVKRAAARAWTNKLPVDLERRRATRIHTVLHVARVTLAHDSGLWRIRNISDSGMLLLTGTRLDRGEPLSIALADGITLDARVEWWDGVRCGVAFASEIDCAGLLERLVDERKAPDYRPPRLAVHSLAIAFCERGMHSVRLTDISQHGAGFIHDGCFRAGMGLKLHLAAGDEYRGVVRWEDSGRAGLQLTEPIPCARLESANRF